MCEVWRIFYRDGGENNISENILVHNKIMWMKFEV